MVMKREHDKRAKTNKPYAVGDKVYVKVNVRKGLNYKLKPLFDGPFQIEELLIANRAIVRNLSNPNDLRTIHLSQIRD